MVSAVNPTRPFPAYLENFLASGGVDESTFRQNLREGRLSIAENVEPVIEGLTNRRIGVRKLNTNRLSNGKIQDIFVFLGKLCYVRNGQFYTLPQAGGAETAIAGLNFNTSNSVNHEFAYGGTPKKQKVEMLDGVNNPALWDGTSLSQNTAFASSPLGVNLGSVRPDKAKAYRGAVAYSFPEGSGFENAVIISDYLDAEKFTAGNSLANGVYIENIGGDGGHITALGTIKRNSADKQSEVLVAFKNNRKHYVSGEKQLPGTGQPFLDFFFNAGDLGAVNQKCIVNFGNDLLAMDPQGIGRLKSGDSQTGINVDTYDAATRINPQIQRASKNPAFKNAHMFICPDRQIIWANVPRNQQSSTQQYGFEYPEVPCDYTIGYRYGLLDITGNLSDVYYNRGGAGWGWSCSAVDGDKIYFGSYFGDIYEVFASDEYERNPLTPNALQVITSTVETGDMKLKTPGQYKQIERMITKWYVDSGIFLNYEITWNAASSGKPYTNKQTEKLPLEPGVYGTDKYGEYVYGATRYTTSTLKPYDRGEQVRIKWMWNSLAQKKQSSGDLNFYTNYGSLLGVKGFIKDGGKGKFI